MSAPLPKCAGPGGKAIFPTRGEAKTYVKTFQARDGGRGKAYRCTFGEHYHVTRSFMGNSGRKGGK